MNILVIYGAGHFNVILKTIDAINRAKPTWEIAGFLDDTKVLKGSSLWGYRVLGGRELLPEMAKKKDVYYFNNVISHWSRSEKVMELLKNHGCKVPNLIHPSIDMNYVKIGVGCLLPEGCVIGPNTTIGNYVNLRLGVVVSHNVVLGDLVFIGPGATIGGGVVLKERSYIGAGATVMMDRTVGACSIVGAVAVVTKDVRDNVTVMGVPAKEIENVGKE